MVFDTKLMFCGAEQRHSNKTQKDYYVVRLFDFESNSSYDLFVKDIEKYKDYKPKQEYNFKLQLTKQNNNINLNIID